MSVWVRKMTEKKLLSFIVPAFNEEENIEPLYTALLLAIDPLLPRYNYEVIFTDDYSTDRTFEILTQLAQNDPNVRVIRFSRNMGFQQSILAGYIRASGDAAVQLDCDLQDPPELIPEFVSLWEEGHQVVYGIRRWRNEPWFKRNMRKAFYRLINFLSEDKLPLDAGDFRLIDRVVLDQLKKMEDYQPYLRGAIAAMGYSQIGVAYDRGDRLHGTSKFSWGDLIRLAFDGILNHSIVPLRIATYTGLFVSMVTFIGMGVYLIGKLLFNQSSPPGFTTTTSLILGSLSLNALFLGIIGEYLGRIYRQVKKQPVAIVEHQINLETDEERERSLVL